MTAQLVKIEYIEGDVIDDDETCADREAFAAFASCFHWENRNTRNRRNQARTRKPYNDNGREYVNGQWEYTAARGRKRSPFECPVNIIDGYGADCATDGN